MQMEEFLEMVDDIAGEIPREFFDRLNGGIVLRPEQKYHPQGVGNDLFIMGEYSSSRTMGRTIYIYYGSYEAVYGYMEKEQLRKRVKETVLHEFTHHFESLAGERDLEIEDAVRIAEYKKRKRIE
jgi:Uncharacterized protein conserved in bacteria